jgi:hypothetical protein
MLFHVVAFILLLLLLGKSKNKHDITTNEPYTVIATLLERFQLSVVYYTFLLSCRFVAYRRLAKACEIFFFLKDPAQSSKYFYYLFSDRWRWWRRFRCVAREELRRPTRWYRTLTGLSEEKRKEWNFFWLRCKTKDEDVHINLSAIFKKADAHEGTAPEITGTFPA